MYKIHAASFYIWMLHHLAGVPVDLVEGAGVSCRDEQVVVGGNADRVDVEVVVGNVGCGGRG
jgi:hypothetical protein